MLEYFSDMVEKSSTTQRNIFDDYPYGWGEAPALGTPGEIERDEFREVKRSTDLKRESTRFGPLRDVVQKLKKNHAVGLQYKGPRSVRIIVADHSDSIKKITVAGLATGIAFGVVFIHEQRKSKK